MTSVTPAPASSLRAKPQLVLQGKTEAAITPGLSTAPSLRPVKTRVSLGQAARGCKGGTLRVRVGARVGPAHQHVPSPPSLACIYTCFGKGNGYKWLFGAWHELFLWAASWQLGKHPCSRWARGLRASTANWPHCLLHSAQVRLWGLRDCKILEIKFLVECQLFVHSYAALKFILALFWYGCNAMRRSNVQQFSFLFASHTVL